ncbi:hypothetical protein [Parafilimonas sp.]|uniref:hypothetical protein n=1 Tax=Parafilimonas sp. TaxID=1969739 RepID=UPI0039E4CC40
MARKGIGFLCHAANVPVLPVICYRNSLEEITLHFFNLIYPDITKKRDLFAKMLMQELYNLASPFIKSYPHQWEAWLYLHKVVRIINPLPIGTSVPNVSSVDRLRFNTVHFGLFKVNRSNYIFNKSNYISYPVADDIYSTLSEARVKSLNKNCIDVNLLHELYKHQVLIDT